MAAPRFVSSDTRSVTVEWDSAECGPRDASISGYFVVFQAEEFVAALSASAGVGAGAVRRSDDDDDEDEEERDGGSPAAEKWMSGRIRVADALTLCIGGLKHDTRYRFAVGATNVVGEGPVGEWSTYHFTQGPPTVPMVRAVCVCASCVTSPLTTLACFGFLSAVVSRRLRVPACATTACGWTGARRRWGSTTRPSRATSSDGSWRAPPRQTTTRTCWWA
jgi:hypothetical protein